MQESVYDERPSCTSCVFKFNEMLGSLFPCNMCQKMSEYVPIDEESFIEGYWLDDPAVVDQVLTEIDYIVEKIDILNTILPKMGVEERCFNAVSFLKNTKRTIIETILKDDKNDQNYPYRYPYRACYPQDDCKKCGMEVDDPDSCPF